MAFDAKILRVLVASPGDVGEERNVIPEIINDWNTINSVISKIVLMPVKWETHSAPLMGDRPQAIINKQLVKDCDVLIGVFWTRVGTNTGVAISGTAEEIEQFVEMKKPVMLYFSQSPIEPDKIDVTQFTTLKTFKEKMRLQGLTESYNGIHDFRQKFSRQLSLNIGNLINSSLAENTAAKTKSNSKKQKIDQTKIEPAQIKPIEVEKEQLTGDIVDAYLTKAVNSVAEPNGWARIAAVGLYLHTYTPIDYRDYNFPKLQGFLKSRKLFEFKEDKGHPILRIIPK